MTKNGGRYAGIVLKEAPEDPERPDLESKAPLVVALPTTFDKRQILWG
jgi:hypothetical protein